MATLIPTLGSARFDSRGELRIAERLKDFLEENAYIWHNLPMGPARKRAGHEWPQMAVLYPAHWVGEDFARVISKLSIPVDVAKAACVAITRATHEAFLKYSGRSRLVERLTE